MNKELIAELKSLRRPDPVDDSRNGFWEVSPEAVQSFENQANVKLPPLLRKFYEEVGHGSIQQSRTGEWAEFDLNIFVDLSRLLDLYLRRDPSFEVDPEIVEQGDLAFFDMGSHSYLVVRPLSSKPDAIYWPYETQSVYSSVWDFADQLLENPRCYLESR